MTQSAKRKKVTNNCLFISIPKQKLTTVVFTTMIGKVKIKER